MVRTWLLRGRWNAIKIDCSDTRRRREFKFHFHIVQLITYKCYLLFRSKVLLLPRRPLLLALVAAGVHSKVTNCWLTRILTENISNIFSRHFFSSLHCLSLMDISLIFLALYDGEASLSLSVCVRVCVSLFASDESRRFKVRERPNKIERAIGWSRWKRWSNWLRTPWEWCSREPWEKWYITSTTHYTCALYG